MSSGGAGSGAEEEEGRGGGGVAGVEVARVGGKRPAGLEPGLQLGRERNQARVEAEAAREVLQRAAVMLDGQAAMQTQSLSRHGGGDVGVAVPVAADPRGERQPARRGPYARIKFSQP